MSVLYYALTPLLPILPFVPILLLRYRHHRRPCSVDSSSSATSSTSSSTTASPALQQRPSTASSIASAPPSTASTKLESDLARPATHAHHHHDHDHENETMKLDAVFAGAAGGRLRPHASSPASPVSAESIWGLWGTERPASPAAKPPRPELAKSPASALERLGKHRREVERLLEEEEVVKAAAAAHGGPGQGGIFSGFWALGFSRRAATVATTPAESKAHEEAETTAAGTSTGTTTAVEHADDANAAPHVQERDIPAPPVVVERVSSPADEQDKAILDSLPPADPRPHHLRHASRSRPQLRETESASGAIARRGSLSALHGVEYAPRQEDIRVMLEQAVAVMEQLRSQSAQKEAEEAAKEAEAAQAESAHDEPAAAAEEEHEQEFHIQPIDPSSFAENVAEDASLARAHGEVAGEGEMHTLPAPSVPAAASSAPAAEPHRTKSYHRALSNILKPRANLLSHSRGGSTASVPLGTEEDPASVAPTPGEVSGTESATNAAPATPTKQRKRRDSIVRRSTGLWRPGNKKSQALHVQTQSKEASSSSPEIQAQTPASAERPSGVFAEEFTPPSTPPVEPAQPQPQQQKKRERRRSIMALSKDDVLHLIAPLKSSSPATPATPATPASPEDQLLREATEAVEKEKKSNRHSVVSVASSSSQAASNAPSTTNATGFPTPALERKSSYISVASSARIPYSSTPSVPATPTPRVLQRPRRATTTVERPATSAGLLGRRNTGMSNHSTPGAGKRYSAFFGSGTEAVDLSDADSARTAPKVESAAASPVKGGKLGKIRRRGSISAGNALSALGLSAGKDGIASKETFGENGKEKDGAKEKEGKESKDGLRGRVKTVFKRSQTSGNVLVKDKAKDKADKEREREREREAKGKEVAGPA